MSIELILLPMAVAAFSAWQAKSGADEAGRHFVAVHTRMRDGRLLKAALADTGATIADQRDVIVAAWGETQGRFTRDQQGIWSVHFPGETRYEMATTLIAKVDAAYGLQVQHEVLARLRDRAPQAGMEIESESVENDHSVTLVLNVNSGGVA